MSDVLTQLDNIRSRLAKAQKEHDILTGKLESANEELAKLGYKTVKKAEDAMDKLEKEAEEVEENLNTMLDKFKEAYPELVDYA